MISEATTAENSVPKAGAAGANGRMFAGKIRYRWLETVISSPLSKVAKVVAAYLHLRVNAHGTCWPKIETIMTGCDLCESATYRALAVLRSAGFVATSPPNETDHPDLCRRLPANRRPSIYRLNQPAGVSETAPLAPPPGVSESTGLKPSRGVTSGAVGVAKVGILGSTDWEGEHTRRTYKGTLQGERPETRRKTEEETDPGHHSPSPVKKPRTKPIAAAADVLAVYAAYPRKKGRGRALPAIAKALTKVGFEPLLAAERPQLLDTTAANARDTIRIGAEDAPWRHTLCHEPLDELFG